MMTNGAGLLTGAPQPSMCHSIDWMTGVQLSANEAELLVAVTQLLAVTA